jgi:hypothetical protein
MSKKHKIKFKLGQQVLYNVNKHTNLVLTFVEVTKNGLGRFFISQFPSLEYYLHLDSEKIKVENDIPFEELQEEYVAFKGGDDKKQQAYNLLLVRGRSEQHQGS